ncbi:FAD-dependent oxidoreductase [Marinilongibacter aquaticus]|uniref:NAD(P)/FAD-dependent oxidoreductase n=1 Tax=Marinilongibacter aquaticus TaxID=2975157 RepID=UPI0021BD8E6F|nr:FAD-dependent oxidoreductase [Marinilongibacter aquaticus]UBM57887.1 FAD-dependent oxidoreductase [Marinilongibacter aquaticus]
MLAEKINTDIAIIGGGLAGLACALQLAHSDFQVSIIEKKPYPRHKVCGEYVGMESYDFLENLGLPLSEWQLPRIQQLHLSHENGQFLNTPLAPGGFGISRYKLEHALFRLCQQAGVHFIKGNVQNYTKTKGDFSIQTAEKQHIRSSVCIAAYGKNPPHEFKTHPEKEQKWFGLKWHAVSDIPATQINLHFFQGGYLGCSQIEQGKTNICLLASRESLQASENRLDVFLEKVAFRNADVRSIFTNSELLFDKPLSIANIQFSKKYPKPADLLHIGDAAGMIAPLSGNGMSMALRSSKMLAEEIRKHGLQSSKTFDTYPKRWQKAFQTRLSLGNSLQNLSLHPMSLPLLIQLGKLSPTLFQKMIRLTHGKSF